MRQQWFFTHTRGRYLITNEKALGASKINEMLETPFGGASRAHAHRLCMRLRMRLLAWGRTRDATGASVSLPPAAVFSSLLWRRKRPRRALSQCACAHIKCDTRAPCACAHITRRTPRARPARTCAGRYVLFLMSIFAIYCGTLYNEVFGLPMDVFRSRWGYYGES